jgi:hypothetical protein
MDARTRSSYHSAEFAQALNCLLKLGWIGEFRSETVSSPPSTSIVPFRRRSKEMVHCKTGLNDCQGGGTQNTYGGLEYRNSTSS